MNRLPIWLDPLEVADRLVREAQARDEAPQVPDAPDPEEEQT